MIRVRYEITLKEGVNCDLLFTLSLFGVAKQRGINLGVVDSDDANERINYFLKVIYCAALNAWEYKTIDNPALGEFGYTLLDIAEWAGANPRDFARMIRNASEAITGSALPDPSGEAVENEKKK